MELRVYVDRRRCVGHGLCYAGEPSMFEPDEAGCGSALAETVPAGSDRAAAARRAAANCPEEAIQVQAVARAGAAVSAAEDDR